jgi:hypothetical protein
MNLLFSMYNKIGRMPSSGILRPVTLVRTDASEEPMASIIRETKIEALGTTLAVTINRCTLKFFSPL